MSLIDDAREKIDEELEVRRVEYMVDLLKKRDDEIGKAQLDTKRFDEEVKRVQDATKISELDYSTYR